MGFKEISGEYFKKFLHDIQKDDHQEERTEGCIFLQISMPVLHYHGPEKWLTKFSLKEKQSDSDWSLI